MDKTKLRTRFLALLQEKFAKPHNPKEMQALVQELAGVLAKSFTTKVESEVRVLNQEEASKALIAYLKENGLKLEKPEWWPEEKALKVKFPKSIRADIDSSVIVAMGTLLATFLGELLRGIGKIAQGVFTMRLMPEHYLTPQQVVLINPRTGQPIGPEEMGTGIINMAPAVAASGGPTHVGIRGATSITDGTVSVPTAGTRVQMPNVPCSRVFIQSHPANGELGAGATIVIGGPEVLADANTRRGLALFSTQWQEFQVDNLRRLYIDSTENGGKINYIAEV